MNNQERNRRRLATRLLGKGKFNEALNALTKEDSTVFVLMDLGNENYTCNGKPITKGQYDSYDKEGIDTSLYIDAKFI